MKKSIGAEKSTLVREANAAFGAAAAASGSASPPCATWVAEAMTIFCAGQIISQN